MGLNPPEIPVTVLHVVDYSGTPLSPTTNMYYSEMQQVIETSVEFPITHDTVLEELGDITLTAHTGDAIAVGDVLSRSGEHTYQSSDMLYTTIIGNLGDSFIGRKYSDERGGAHTCPDPRSTPRQSL